ncbi:MAG: hypothetical protein HY459_01770 [Parcubacteria group bacterium]|nr:hypothetical protein [Parcubacteria group bacterium]
MARFVTSYDGRYDSEERRLAAHDREAADLRRGGSARIMKEIPPAGPRGILVTFARFQVATGGW